eukprot:CAMPEP_0178495858 /NCGR_PEP_ID=MMETSP0696-20121128/13782_1 /TAXON_ID=265572 /ORGANISM="Extubocellulus spinifer, Strain CCMP396" /LENGTH=93 /DNA_ID=CAMNT_0020124051 /DNA_START=342 /DNA_END=620 /DNA_ORIENTATION=+
MMLVGFVAILVRALGTAVLIMEDVEEDREDKRVVEPGSSYTDTSPQSIRSLFSSSSSSSSSAAAAASSPPRRSDAVPTVMPAPSPQPQSKTSL